MGGFANNAPIVTDGLVFYVDAGNSKSYSGSGTTWSDLVGGNDGSLVNGPVFSSTSGGILQFDGTDDYMSTTSSTVSGVSALTIDAWVKFDNTSIRNVLFHHWIAAGNFAVLARVDSNNLQFFTFTSGTVGGTTQSFTSTGWNHISYTYDGAIMKTYVNGVQSGTTFSQSGNIATVSSSSDFVGNYAGGYEFNGDLSSMRIYDKGLSSTEILQNYNALKNRFV